MSGVNYVQPTSIQAFSRIIGTFSFVFIGAGAAAVIGESVGFSGIAAIALAHGLAIMAFAFAYGPVSGGHMNPAVTVGVFAAGAMDATEAIGYVISQLIGGIAGALMLRILWAPPRAWHPGARAQPRSRRYGAYDHACCRLHDRERCSHFSWSRSCSAPRWRARGQSGTAGHRNDGYL